MEEVNGNGADGGALSDDPFDRPRRAVPVAPPCQRIKVLLVQPPNQPLPLLNSQRSMSSDCCVSTSFLALAVVYRPLTTINQCTVWGVPRALNLLLHSRNAGVYLVYCMQLHEGEHDIAMHPCVI